MKLKHLRYLLPILFACSCNTEEPADLNEEILLRYYDLDIPFFTENNQEYHEKPLYLAFKNWIEGNESKYLEHLEQAQRHECDSAKQISKLLFKAYLKSGHSKKALELNKSEKLGFDQREHTEHAKSIFGKPRLRMNVDSTTVKFDRFYFKAVVHRSDTVKVMLDTGAPGISVSKELVEKYNWEKDTTHFDVASVAMLNITYNRYPVLIPNLSIGDAHLYNIAATFDDPSTEDKKKLNIAGVQDFDILMGLDVFYDLIDGIDFNYKDEKLTLIKRIDKYSAIPNFIRVSGKPAIRFKIENTWKKAFLDTGSPKHVLTKDIIENSKVLNKREGSYGNFIYGLHTILVDELLNLSNTEIEFADYGGRVVDKTFNIKHLFGTFHDKNLSFDLKNRVVTLK
ncbi:MAG: hypothetical protein Tsb004_15500 [Allomuricauda sp.]